MKEDNGNKIRIGLGERREYPDVRLDAAIHEKSHTVGHYDQP